MEEHSPSSKAQEQFMAEVPAFLRSALQKCPTEAVNLADLFTEPDNDTRVTSNSEATRDTSTVELLQPGPFTTVILDMQFSTDSSSFTPIKCRDLPLALDSDTTSTHSTISIGEYLAYCREADPDSEVTVYSDQASSNQTKDTVCIHSSLTSECSSIRGFFDNLTVDSADHRDSRSDASTSSNRTSSLQDGGGGTTASTKLVK